MLNNPRAILNNSIKNFHRLFLKKLYPVCYLAIEEVAILSDGSVTTCCNDSKGENIFGNIYKDSFEEIWNRNFSRFRMTNLLDHKVCFRCIGTDSIHSPSLRSTKKDRKIWESKRLPFPKSLVLEISGICNYRCDGCFSNDLKKYRHPFLDFEKAKKNLGPLLEKIEYIRLYNYGEPLLNKQFNNILYEIRKISPTIHINISSNGMLLTDEKIEAIVAADVNSVCISIHGGPGTKNMLMYSKQNADYDTVLSNTSKLIRHRNNQGKKNPEVLIKSILFNWNDSDRLMDQLRSDGDKIGADSVGWALDCGAGLLDRSSVKYRVGSEAYNKLKRNGELL